MEMECVNIKNTLFKEEWEKMENYYYRNSKDKSKKHTRDEANFYYSQLKDISDELFLKTLDNVYNHCKYFPCIAEIREQVPNTLDSTENIVTPEWILHPEICKSEPLTLEEQKELEEILKKYR